MPAFSLSTRSNGSWPSEISLDRHSFHVTIRWREADFVRLEGTPFDPDYCRYLHAAYARLRIIRIFHERAPTIPFP